MSLGLPDWSSLRHFPYNEASGRATQGAPRNKRNFLMIAFLRWVRSIVVGMLNGVAMVALFVVLFVVVLAGIGLATGDGLPGKMVLSLDLRKPIQDSANASVLSLREPQPTVMGIVLALDRAGRDSRVKGVFMRVGTADLSVPQAEEIGAALKRF